jgi:glutamate synthase domain-containing protein 1
MFLALEAEGVSCSTSSTKNAASSPSTAIRKRPISPTSACTRCSTAARKAQASAASDGKTVYTHKSMGHVADIFTPRAREMPGHVAIGHTRYSTAGDTVLLNAQPFSVNCNKGRIAVAHNGNITNAGELRRELESDGSIFQATSDTEVVLHLVAHSRERTLAGALREALLQLKALFRWSSWPRTASSSRATRTASVRWRWDNSKSAGEPATFSRRKPARST